MFGLEAAERLGARDRSHIEVVELISETKKMIEAEKNRPPRVTDNGFKLIMLTEGYSAVPYICAAGTCTIGKGTTRDEDFNPVTMNHPKIDIEIANRLFYRDVKIFAAGVRRDVKVQINDNQFSALVSLAYNIGQGNFRASTLLRRLNRGDYEGCAANFWQWRRANGVILAGLVKRRELERLMFVS